MVSANRVDLRGGSGVVRPLTPASFAPTAEGSARTRLQAILRVPESTLFTIRLRLGARLTGRAPHTACRSSHTGAEQNHAEYWLVSIHLRSVKMCRSLLACGRRFRLRLRQRQSGCSICFRPCCSIARERGARRFAQQSRGGQRRAEPLRERHALLPLLTILSPRAGDVTYGSSSCSHHEDFRSGH